MCAMFASTAHDKFCTPVRRSPKLLICDEATSALDTATERGIMDSLTELASGRTSIFVAHRWDILCSQVRHNVLDTASLWLSSCHSGCYRSAVQRAANRDSSMCHAGLTCCRAPRDDAWFAVLCRLSTIRNCDKIVVMSAGQVVEEGSHQDLMNAGRVYADMVRHAASRDADSVNAGFWQPLYCF